ncbi:MAG: hypothetical protein KGH79_04090 [Patescibacteria group bacterium]|nr:hypothetical protein [Patescibacteria group bacterium]
MLNETDLKASVLQKIRKGEVSMRPRLYFIARLALAAFVAIAALALAMFVLSFVFFSIHESGEQFLLGFGGRGVLTFITLFPWWSLLLTLALIFALDYVLRYFKFGYRIPMLEIVLGALAVVVAAGVLISATPLHSVLLSVADNNELPVLGPLYEDIHDSHEEQGIYRGVISSIQGNAVVIAHNDGDRDTDDGTSTIMLPPGFNVATLYVGERLYVAGDKGEGGVNAYGIEKFAPRATVK